MPTVCLRAALKPLAADPECGSEGGDVNVGKTEANVAICDWTVSLRKRLAPKRNGIQRSGLQRPDANSNAGELFERTECAGRLHNERFDGPSECPPPDAVNIEGQPRSEGRMPALLGRSTRADTIGAPIHHTARA
jgi:hypothetical protein